MRKYISKILVPVAALVALSLTLFSCSKEEEADTVQPEIYLTQNPASEKSGSQFVRITAGKEWTLDIAYEGEQSGWASFDSYSGTGSASNLKLRYTANSSSESRYATITLKSRGGVAEISFRQYGVDENKIIQGNYGSATAKQGWLELPATSATDGLEFFTHTMTVGSRPVRNFSYYYSYEDFDALWVAYPLNSGLIGSTVGRNEDAWGYDPQMPESCQQYVVSTYGTGYTRGHQIPSADRQGTLDRNAATFYATNMTPQDYDFNSGIWVRLEGAVRSLAKSSDTLYVVTGAVLGSKKSRDRLGHSITVPDAYFKAFLFSGTGYGKFSGYSAAGVYMEHNGSLSGDLGDYAMSIDDLEAKTGIEFFVNLPNKVGAETTKKLKAQQPKSWLPVSWY